MTDVDGWKHPTPPSGPGGEVVAEIQRLKRAIEALQTRAPLRSASISEGGLVIKNGGTIRIEDGGGLSAYRVDGTHATSLGPIYDAADGGALTWYGLIVEDVAGEEVLAVLTRISDGVSFITADPSGSVQVDAGGQINLDAGQQLYLHTTGSGENAFLYAENGGGAFVRATSGTGPVAMTSAGGSASVTAGAGVSVTGATGATLASSGGQVLIDAGDEVFVEAGDAFITDSVGATSIGANGAVFLEAGQGGASAIVQLRIPQSTASAARRVEIADSNSLIADFDSAGMHLYDAPAGTGNALVLNAGNGRVQQVSSSRRFKTDIEDHRVDLDALLQLRGRSWRDLSEVEDNPNTTNRYAGLVAEEVHDLGLTEAVLYDPDGSPRNINDRPLIVGLLQLAQRQQAQIDALTARLDALDGGAPAKATRTATARTATTAAAADTHSGDVIAIPGPPEPRPEPTPRPDRRPTPQAPPVDVPEPEPPQEA